MEHRESISERQSQFELPHPVICRIGDGHLCVVKDRAVQVAELAGLGAGLAEQAEELAVLAENLDAVVADLGDVDVTTRLPSQSRRCGGEEGPEIPLDPHPIGVSIAGVDIGL